METNEQSVGELLVQTPGTTKNIASMDTVRLTLDDVVAACTAQAEAEALARAKKSTADMNAAKQRCADISGQIDALSEQELAQLRKRARESANRAIAAIDAAFMADPSGAVVGPDSENEETRTARQPTAVDVTVKRLPKYKQKSLCTQEIRVKVSALPLSLDYTLYEPESGAMADLYRQLEASQRDFDEASQYAAKCRALATSGINQLSRQYRARFVKTQLSRFSDGEKFLDELAGDVTKTLDAMLQ